MSLYAQILLFIIGFASGFCLLLAYKVPKTIENIGRIDEKKAKPVKRLGYTLLAIAIVYAFVLNFCDLPKLYQCNRILINLILGALLALPVLIHLRFIYLLHLEASKNQLILIGTNGIIIASIILAEAFVLGMFNAIHTPWMSIELSPHYDAKLKPSIYEVKRELNGFIEPLLKKLDIGCAMLGDRRFAGLTIEYEGESKEKPNTYKSKMENSEAIVYPLLLLIQKALYIQELGEPRLRLAHILAHVKRSLQLLLDNSTQKNYKAAIKELDKWIKISFSELDKLLESYGEAKKPITLKIPYDDKTEEKYNTQWCRNIQLKEKIYAAYTYDQSKIDKIDEKTFMDAANMPYIYAITAVYMLYDSDIDGAIDLLHKSIGGYKTKLDKYKPLHNEMDMDKPGYSDMNVYYFLSQLVYTDARPVEYYMIYDEYLLDIASHNLEKLDKSKTGYVKDALVKRYEKAVYLAKNNISYGVVRKQSRLTDDDFALARKYANEAYGYANNSKDPVYIDTLGYVRLVTVLRNGGLDSEQQKHEIESARILLERAYSIAKDEYKAIVENDKVDAIDESEARQSLMIYEDHLNEALRYEAEINRIE